MSLAGPALISRSKQWRLRSTRGEKAAVEQPREALAAVSHHPVVIPGEYRRCERGDRVHPRLRGVNVPFVDDGRDRGGAILGEQAPASCAGELAARLALEQVGLLHPGRRHREVEVVRELRAPAVPTHLAHAALVAVGHLLGAGHAAPPLGPALGIPDRLPNRLSGRLQAPGREESVLGHGSLLVAGGGGLAVAEVRGHRLDDLREADHRDRVVMLDLAAVDLPQESGDLIEAAELRVVMLDVPGRELTDSLDLHVVDHGGEELLPRAVLIAHRDPHDLAALVLARLVPEPDRRSLSPALQLVDEGRREEIECKQPTCHAETEPLSGWPLTAPA